MREAAIRLDMLYSQVVKERARVEMLAIQIDSVDSCERGAKDPRPVSVLEECARLKLAPLGLGLAAKSGIGFLGPELGGGERVSRPDAEG